MGLNIYVYICCKHFYMKKILILGCLFSFTGLMAQDGPGGVGNSTSNIVWLDANELSYIDGGIVDVFGDISGNGNDFTQLSSSEQPTYKVNVVNGMSVVRFDGVNDNMLSSNISALESANVTSFIVFKQNSMTNTGLLGSNYGSDSQKWRIYGQSNGNVRTIQYSGGVYHANYNAFNTSFNFISSHITPSNIKLYKEGQLQQSVNGIYTTPSSHNYLKISGYPGHTNNNWALDGDIAEVIIFNTSLNDLERVIVENYLGAKYNRSIAEDYYAYETTHKYGVIGIGNDGTNVHSSSTGYGVLNVGDASGLGSNEYMFIGHDGVGLSSLTTSDLPPTFSRLSRTWRVDETGELDDVTLVFDVSGEAGFGVGSSYTLLVDADSDGDFSNANLVAGTFNAVNQTVSFTLDLTSGETFTLGGIEAIPVAIHSIDNGNWSALSTWDCACIPTYKDTVYIENGFNVGVDVEAYSHNIYVTTGSTLEMLQEVNLSIFGNLQVDGDALLTAGEIKFIGADSQTISAGNNTLSLNRVEVNNENGDDVNFINGDYILESTLFPNSGNMVIGGGATFVVNSTSANTSGRIDVMSPSFTLTGNVSVKRFLPAGVAGERNISSPVIGANLSEWDNDLSISGEGFPDGCAADANGCYFSCKKFIGGDFTSDYIDVTNPNEPLESGIGYELFLGDDLTSFSGATITSTGQFRDYADFSIHYPVVKQGWNIVGNPYASPILFSQMSTPQMYNYFYVYDAASGSYQWYDKTSNTSSIPELADGKIAIGQGFWVNAGGVPGVHFSQSIKTSNTATFIRSSGLDESIYLTLTQEGTTYKNIANIGFNELAYDNSDSLDIGVLTVAEQKASSLYINSEGVLLAKNTLEKNGRDKILNLSVKILNEGYFNISAANLENVKNYGIVTLIDNETGSVINLKEELSYKFHSEEGEYQRFQLILSNEVITNNETSIFESEKDDSELTITQLGNAINIESEESIEGITEVSVINILGQTAEYTESIKIESGSNIVFIPENLSGMYLVVIKSSNGVKTKKIML